MNNRIVELAIKGLEAERAEIDQELADLRKQMNRDGNAPTRRAKQAGPGGLRAAGRKKLSDMMKARWAARRRAAKK